MRTCSTKLNNKAITLVEMMVVMIILAIVVLGAFSGFDNLRRFMQINANKLEALGHSQLLLEELRNVDVAVLVDTPVDGTEIELPADSYLRTTHNATRRYYIADYEHPVGTVIGKKIDVIVNWDE